MYKQKPYMPQVINENELNFDTKTINDFETIQDAKNYYTNLNYTVVILEENSIITADVNLKRIRLIIKDDKLIKIERG